MHNHTQVCHVMGMVKVVRSCDHIVGEGAHHYSNHIVNGI